VTWIFNQYELSAGIERRGRGVQHHAGEAEQQQ
jgi:hypothetical protein